MGNATKICTFPLISIIRSSVLPWYCNQLLSCRSYWADSKKLLRTGARHWGAFWGEASKPIASYLMSEWSCSLAFAGASEAARSCAKAGATHVGHELLADGADLLGQGGAEHHDLLLVRRHLEDVLQVAAHVCTTHSLVSAHVSVVSVHVSVTISLKSISNPTLSLKSAHVSIKSTHSAHNC